jgi:hypothetical protein
MMSTNIHLYGKSSIWKSKIFCIQQQRHARYQCARMGACLIYVWTDLHSGRVTSALGAQRLAYLSATVVKSSLAPPCGERQKNTSYPKQRVKAHEYYN